MKLLLIDDDQLDRMAAIRVLRQSAQPITVVEAATAEEGIQQLEDHHFDAILLDYRLPDTDGLDVLRLLRINRGTSIIMLSGCEDEELAARCIEAGAQDFLLKQELNSRHLLRSIAHARQRHGLEMELRKSHEKLRELAQQDQLTGLHNRYYFEKQLRETISRAYLCSEELALLLLDLDNFKVVNDTLGHDAGDQLLRIVSSRLASVVREGDLLCRLGGDEFAILAHHIDEDEDINHLAHRLMEVLSDPIELRGSEIHVTTSIGVASLSVCSEGTEGLMKCADIAMYRAKDTGRNQIHHYTSMLHRDIQQRVQVERDLRKAVEEQQFVIHYQPQVTVSGMIVSVEALVRWQHPQRGLLYPGDFIGIAEDSGLIEPIGRWVLQNACQQLASWKHRLTASGQQLSLAVNLSSVQLRKDNLLPAVNEALATSGLAPENLELELTENMLIEEPEKAAVVLEQLAGRGVTISVDDFGTGYSSLSHLRVFPISTLKIDRSFVQEIEHREQDARFFKAVTSLAKTMELTVVAEGVETTSQAKLCLQAGCDRLQGYLFSKPVPPARLEMLLFSEEEADSMFELAPLPC
ncbi:bifunctional diguanylate cyclase/phosphodiesterase [Motiliproteus sp. MSK22-1]|uniref:putative bifunctional diguanylate cyclase/phosphodiesterase n=1 Tax=Motiliproteus sp. MSK22-1 TaxID=1897630 RepID=UPI000978722C|nr:GGDEF domain-containing response regulator [Motiliproteus sp. MSK22-1]OMH31660.1 hypothetical protein BGP75_16140 [Motiliproteus sp. MSK22-1]